MLPVSRDSPFLIAPLVFSNFYLSCVLCILCCQFLGILHFLLPLRYSADKISEFRYVVNVQTISYFIFSSNSRLIFCFLCKCIFYCCPYFNQSIVYLKIPMLPVSRDSPFLIAPLVFSNVYLSCVLCILCWQFLCIVHF
jgi:hypothetical protein